MATVIFIDQENGGVASTILSKDRLQSTIPGKTLLGSHPRKVFGSSGTVVKPRKALGNVNTAVPQKKGALGVKNSAPVTKQAPEACIKPSKRNYPEIEKCLPYDPADFETFDVPEEHKLSHFYLGGAPLFVHEKEAANFDALTQEPAPMDVPVFSWESDISSTLPSFLATFDIALDLPQVPVSSQASKQSYPEIEKCLPYHPEDMSSTCPSFLATLDEVTLDMPKMKNC